MTFLTKNNLYKLIKRVLSSHALPFELTSQIVTCDFSIFALGQFDGICGVVGKLARGDLHDCIAPTAHYFVARAEFCQFLKH